MIARKKIGIEIPISDPTKVKLSKIPPCRLRGEEAEWDADRDREDHRRNRKLDRRGKPLADLGGDLAVRRQLTPRSRSIAVVLT